MQSPANREVMANPHLEPFFASTEASRSLGLLAVLATCCSGETRAERVTHCATFDGGVASCPAPGELGHWAPKFFVRSWASFYSLR